MTATTGARPENTRNETEAAQSVRRMFDSIAPRYDLLNRVLSFDVAPRWWRRAARTFAATLAQPQACVVDLCCGTGSLTVELEKLRPPDAAPILAMDFSQQMLARARPRLQRSVTVQADAMQLPLRDASVDLLTTAFGFRNLPNYQAALKELRRVLKPGGVLAILEANEPEGAWAGLYRFYFHRVVPRIGSWISSRSAYAYLPASVARFPRPQELIHTAENTGFSSAQWTPFTLGIAGLYICRK